MARKIKTLDETLGEALRRIAILEEDNEDLQEEISDLEEQLEEALDELDEAEDRVRKEYGEAFKDAIRSALNEFD